MAAKAEAKPWQIALGLVLLGGLSILGAALGVRAWDQFTELSPDVGVALLTGLFTVGGLVVNRRYEHAQAVKLDLRAQKLPVYTGFIDFWFRTLLHKQMGLKAPTDSESSQFFAKFTKDLITWGSDGTPTLARPPPPSPSPPSPRATTAPPTPTTSPPRPTPPRPRSSPTS